MLLFPRVLCRDKLSLSIGPTHVFLMVVSHIVTCGGNLRDELEGYGIGTVPSVLRCEPLAEEDMAQVGAAVGALDLRPVSVRVGNPLDRARDLVVEGRPTAPRVELVFRTIEGRVASLADVRPRPEVALVLAG